MGDSHGEIASTGTALQRAKRPGPAPALLAVGVVALLVSIWALAGPVTWLGQGAVAMGPLVVIAAIVAGAALIFGSRRGV